MADLGALPGCYESLLSGCRASLRDRLSQASSELFPSLCRPLGTALGTALPGPLS